MSQGPLTASPESLLPPGCSIGTFSPALALLPGAAQLLGVGELVVVPRASRAADLTAVVSWTLDPNEGLSRRFAQEHGLPLLRAAPGFLFRVGVRGHAEPPLSLVLDEGGHYDGGQLDARLVRMLNSQEELGPSDVARARKAIGRIVAGRISRWQGRSPDQAAAALREDTVLVVDEAPAEQRSAQAGAPPGAFSLAVAAARRENPGAHILIASAGSDGGPLTILRSIRGEHAEQQVAREVNAFDLLDRVSHVYVVGGQLGFEALMCGKRVSCFGSPWYAGWGLTDDRVPALARRRTRSLEELFFAAYVSYARYADPETGARWELEQALDFVERQLGHFAQNRGTIFCHGFTLWKRNFVRAYLRSPGNRIEFIDNARQARRKGFDGSSKLLVWGVREEPDVAALAREHGVPLWRMEDGFLRSVGLGADLTVPASLVVDRQGIYFDPSTPSELETILQTADFTADELVRARALRELIVSSALSKYNVGDAAARLVRPAGAGRVLLVPGQVEDDASIRRGCPGIRTNRALLEAVRRENPDAFIIYKPHPDVTDARREGAVPEHIARSLADQVLLSVPLPACLSVVDEVHTLTSLVGFEALLRGLRVSTYGQPFYAGWGLTRDRHPLERRTRKLTLDELVTGVLLRYPRYLGSRSRMFTTPEVVAVQLREQMKRAPKRTSTSRAQRELRRVVHAIGGVLDVP